MTGYAILRERIAATDRRLRRHINHDSRSWLYPYVAPEDELIRSMRHIRRVPILDQGNIGSCVPNGAEGNLGTDPYFATVDGRFAWTEDTAVQWYREVTAQDPYPGQWPQEDTGSDGLSMSKLLVQKGLIAGYEHTFNVDDDLLALMRYPLYVGTYWYESMFNPDSSGVVTVDFGSGVAGGHQYVLDEYDADAGLLGGSNSWGPDWGNNGRFYISRQQWTQLRAQDGDVIVWRAASQPPPVPVDPSTVLASAFRHNGWISRPHVGDNNYIKKAALTWLKATGR